MNKYEQLIEHIINDDEAAAKALFHKIVVEKSRDIYESLMDEEMGGSPAQGFVQDMHQQDDAAQEHGLGEDDEEAGEIELGGGDDEFDDEETFGEPGENDEQDEHTEIVSKIDDLEAQLAELKDMLSGGDDAGDMDDMDSEEPEMDMDSDFDTEEPAMDSDFDTEESDMSQKPFESRTRKLSDVEVMKEYVNKMADIYNPNMTSEKGSVVGKGTATDGDSKPTINSKGVVRSKDLGKFDGETTDNIARGGSENAADGKPIPKPKNEYTKGETAQPLSTKDGGYKNRIGGNKPWNQKAPAEGHGAEKKGTESGKQAGAKETMGGSINPKSEIGGKVR
jgi:hypothetical protein